MFTRSDGFDLAVTLNQIRNNIKDGSPILINDLSDYGKLYKSIWEYAVYTSEPSKCAFDSHCAHPQWVKSNSIVYLVGIGYKEISGKGYFWTLSHDSVDIFFNKAHQGLINLNPRIIGCSGFGDCGKVREKAIDLVYYLQAYDLLKAGGGLPNGDQDKNGGNCTARNKLREFARNLYKQSDDIINSWSGWKKNHGIICASALGMAAIVLNDAGTETSFLVGVWGWIGDLFGEDDGVEFAPYYSPIKWNELGQGGFSENLFVGHHWKLFGLVSDDVPQAYTGSPLLWGAPYSNNVDHNPYAEGPSYAKYGLFDCGIPAMIAQKNLYPEFLRAALRNSPMVWCFSPTTFNPAY
ncbi:MAG: hypothetical protein NTU43_10960 [Bacteroidetes bacterium]|nr:hypothetical protein [Bacteroidota bacterium]